MSELLSVSTMDRAVITLLGNSASINGGAVYISAIEVGAVFYGALFESKCAESGGGVYAVASGHAVSTDSNTGDTVEHPTTFDTCRFVNNQANNIGGAVRSDSGQDKFNNTTFIGNAAFGGGALLLSGTAYIGSCLF